MQANIALYTPPIGLVFGSANLIQGEFMSLVAFFPWQPDEVVTFRLELTGRNTWVTGTLAFVTSLSEADGAARCRIIEMPEDERRLLDDWCAEWSSGGTSAHPERWVASLSQVSTVGGTTRRALFRNALRERVRQSRAGRR